MFFLEKVLQCAGGTRKKKMLLCAQIEALLLNPEDIVQDRCDNEFAHIYQNMKLWFRFRHDCPHFDYAVHRCQAPREMSQEVLLLHATFKAHGHQNCVCTKAGHSHAALLA